MEVESQENQETIPETAAVDSYDELAAAEPEVPQKRARGRPKGSRNKPKIEKTEEEIEEIEEIPSPPPSPPPTPTPTPKPKTRKSRAKPQQTPASMHSIQNLSHRVYSSPAAGATLPLRCPTPRWG